MGKLISEKLKNGKESVKMEKLKNRLTIFIGIIAIMSLFKFVFTSFGFNWYVDDPVADAYSGGEPDYADGDLEDKLGDSGYYYDLFPEERDGETDDYEKGNIISK